MRKLSRDMSKNSNLKAKKTFMISKRRYFRTLLIKLKKGAKEESNKE